MDAIPAEELCFVCRPVCRARFAAPSCSRGRLAASSAPPRGLTFAVIDDKTGQPVACRMHLVGPGKKPRKADPMPFWSDHFVFPGQITLKLPVGKYTFQLERGPEYKSHEGHFVIQHDAEDTKRIDAASLRGPGRRRLVLAAICMSAAGCRTPSC